MLSWDGRRPDNTSDADRTIIGIAAADRNMLN